MTFFTPAGDGSVRPLPDAAGRWDPDTIRGPALTALLARAVEQLLPAGSGVIPVRSTFDLHGRVPMRAISAAARIVRSGRSLSIAESEIIVDGQVLARCRTALLSPSSTVTTPDDPGRGWAAALPPLATPPKQSLRASSDHGRLYRGSSDQWSASPSSHLSAEPGLIWLYDQPLVEGEAVSGFQLAAAAADLANLGINTALDGLAFINTDVTLSLSRLPILGGVGVVVTQRSESAGISVGSATLFDTAGSCGISTVSALRHEKLRLVPG